MKASFKKHPFLFSILLLLVLVYIAGLIVFSFYTYPRTWINGRERGFVPMDELSQILPSHQPVDFYAEGEKHFLLSRDDIRLKRATADPFVPDQKVAAWPLEVFRHHHYKVDYDVYFDQREMDAAIQRSPFDLKGEAPQNAKLSVKDGQVQVVPAVAGQRFNHEKLEELLLDGLLSGEERVSVEEARIQPSIIETSESFQQAKKELEKLLSVDIIYSFGEKRFELNNKVLAPMLEQDEKGFHVNPDKLLEWFRAMKKEVDTKGKKRQFQATGIGEIQVNGGLYGWIMRAEKTRDQALKFIEAGGRHEAEPVFIQASAAPSLDDIGTTYIEVDLSRQHLWAYQEGKMVKESKLVSGVHNGKNETPTGVNYIWAHETERDLKGVSWDSGEKYVSHVQYWMPINWSGVGLHDASWRKNFGGDIYLKHGSNGCLNLPPETARFIFENFKDGTPVVVYESSTHYSPAQKIE